MLYKTLFRHQSAATAANLTYMSLVMLMFNACSSMYFSCKHLLRNLCTSGRCLNSFYCTMNESNINIDDWMKDLVVMPTKLISEKLTLYPIIFAFDDSSVEKEGDCFEAKERLFDHTTKNGSNYHNGHCFVSLLMMVPAMFYGTVKYVSVPIAHKMWTDEKTKLEIAAELVLKAYTYANAPTQYRILSDSW